MKKMWLIVGIVLILLIAAATFYYTKSTEGQWERTANGEWVPKEGVEINQDDIPPEVIEQQIAIEGALALYDAIRVDDERYEGDCLGRVGNYSVDMVHVPRTGEDNQAKNQCADYLNGVTPYFIELDKEGNIVRVAD